MKTYRIQVRGQMDVNELNPICPHAMTLVQASPDATLFSICTDQSGLLGMLRHLHSLGFEFLSIESKLDFA